MRLETLCLYWTLIGANHATGLAGGLDSMQEGWERVRELLLPVAGPRMEAILSLVPHCHAGMEIGADHGILSAYMLRRGICDRLLVTDISAASLSKAQRLFALHGLEDRASFRVADGLQGLREPVDAIVMAGIGAVTMTDILEKGRAQIGRSALILQPKPDPQAVRCWLAGNGFVMEAERLALDSGRFYVAFRARQGNATYTEKELYLGPCLLRDRPPGWDAYLDWMAGCARVQQKRDTQQQLSWIGEARDER